MKNFYGDRIKYYRTIKKISQFELEIECGFSTGMLSRIEHGLCNPTKETLIKIAITLHLVKAEIIDLFGIDEFTNNNFQKMLT